MFTLLHGQVDALREKLQQSHAVVSRKLPSITADWSAWTFHCKADEASGGSLALACASSFRDGLGEWKLGIWWPSVLETASSNCAVALKLLLLLFESHTYSCYAHAKSAYRPVIPYLWRCGQVECALH